MGVKRSTRWDQMNDSGAEPELPRAVALAWGVSANPQRGPKRELSIERIVDAAVEIADEQGLAGVSMASVAASLGFTPMSLYRYVTAKGDLVALMQEQGIGLPPDELRGADGWRAGLMAWAEAQLEVQRRHPWLLDIPILGTPTTPNNLTWLDAGLEIMRTLPLDYHEKVSITLAVMAHNRFRGIVERGYLAGAEAAGASVDEYEHAGVAILDSLVTADQFPDVRAALDAGVFTGDADPFSWGLERLLDGIERYLQTDPASRATPRGEHPVDPRALEDKHVKVAAKERRDAEKLLRDARKREREAIRHATQHGPRQK